MKKWLGVIALILIVAILASCSDQPVLVVTATPGVETEVPASTEDPTPTQEVVTAVPDPTNSWDVSCVEPGQIVLNENPCLSGRHVTGQGGFTQEYPTGYTVWFDKNPPGTQNQVDFTDFLYYDGGFLVEMTYWQGYAGFTLDTFEPQAGICYLLLVEGTGNVSFEDYFDAADNFYMVARVHLDDGTVVTLSEQPWVEDYGVVGSQISGHRKFNFPFYTLSAHTTLTIQVGVRAIWGSGLPWTYFRFDNIRLVLPLDNQHCALLAGI